NLSIARSLKNFLKTQGYAVIMTRSTTDGLYGMTTKNKKLKDMQERKKIIEEANADLVVSVHCNSYPRSDQTGAQVFYAPGSEDGKQKADLLQSVLRDSLGTSRSAKSGDYFILQCSATPSLLVECGFMTTPAEEKKLVSASYQEKVAYAIFTGIHAILGQG
ncbi:MAG: N-acetylmuramoyl-L-alanine amidase, partial [Clostridiales bacterium]|nr:N-acetylmuramoyl-L-alanine amidase [Clostridiales bacterium]